MADELVISRTFSASRARMWQTWTDPARFSRWFGPKGATTILINADIRAGGQLHCAMDLPGGLRIWAKLAYREVEPLTRLVWEHSFSNADGDIADSPFGGPWPKRLLNSVIFEDAGEGTRLHLTSTPLDADADEIAAFRGALDSMLGGWSGNLDVLEDFLSGS